MDNENGLLSEIFETKYFGTTRCSVPYLLGSIDTFVPGRIIALGPESTTTPLISWPKVTGIIEQLRNSPY